MAVFDFGPFNGEHPITHKRFLGPNGAQRAENVKLWRGSLIPLRAPDDRQTLFNSGQTIYKYGAKWFEWTGQLNVEPTPNPDDAYNRVYISNDADLKVCESASATTGGGPYPTTTYKVGVSAPTAAPTVAVSGTPDDVNDPAETRFYVYTFVNNWGEEGPISPISASVDVRPGETVDLSALEVTGTAGQYTLSGKRIYRTTGSGVNAIFAYVDDVAIASTTHTDVTVFTGEELATTDFDPPPSTIKGLVSVPGGFFAGYVGNNLVFSEPGAVYAWPTRYGLPVSGDISGLGVFGNTVVVTTDAGKLYLASGVHPSAMSLVDTGTPQSCSSAPSIVSVAGGVVYASPDGLMMVNDAGAGLITQGIFSKDQWSALGITTIRGAYWEGLYACFHNNGSFIINPQQPEAGIVTTTETGVKGRFNDLENDNLYIVQGDQIRLWDADTGSEAGLLHYWKSRQEDAQQGVTVRVVEVQADTYPVSVYLYVDGVVQPELVVSDDKPARFVDPPRGRYFEVEIKVGAGVTSNVSHVRLATCMRALNGA